jgi:hypothetical protein
MTESVLQCSSGGVSPEHRRSLDCSHHAGQRDESAPAAGERPGQTSRSRRYNLIQRYLLNVSDDNWAERGAVDHGPIMTSL